MLGSNAEERNLVHSIEELWHANPEPLVQFLHITLNNLATLIIRPTINAVSGKGAARAVI